MAFAVSSSSPSYAEKPAQVPPHNALLVAKALGRSATFPLFLLFFFFSLRFRYQLSAYSASSPEFFHVSFLFVLSRSRNLEKEEKKLEKMLVGAEAVE